MAAAHSRRASATYPSVTPSRQHAPVSGVIVDNEHRYATQDRAIELGRSRRAFNRANGCRKQEGTTPLGFAFEPDQAAHHLHQPLRDRQPKTGTAVLPRR